jgi:hypothetical protein
MMRWRIWLLMLLNYMAVFYLPHIDGYAGELDSVGQMPVMSLDLPRYPTATKQLSHLELSHHFYSLENSEN